MTRWGVLLPTFDPVRTGARPPVVEAARRLEERGARLDEALAALPDLLSGRAVHLLGTALSVPPLEPVAKLPPILVGGRSEAALRRAARFGDSWLPMWLSPAAVAQSAQRLAELAGALGRPAPSVTMLIGVRVD